MCVYTYMCVYTHICICVYTDMCVYVCICMCVYVLCMYVCMYMYYVYVLCIYVCVYVYVNEWFYNILGGIFYSRISRILRMSNTTNFTHGSIYGSYYETNNKT